MQRVRDGLGRCVKSVEDDGAFSRTQPSIAFSNYAIFSYQFTFLWSFVQCKSLPLHSAHWSGWKKRRQCQFHDQLAGRERKRKELNCIDNAGVEMRKKLLIKIALFTNQICDAMVGFHCYLALSWSMKHFCSQWHVGISLTYVVVYTSEKN